MAAHQTHWLRLTRLHLGPHTGTALRIVQLSDLHGRARFLNGPLSQRVNALSPDLVCVTGDLVSDQRDLPKVLAELGRIRCTQRYFVRGNWEQETRQGRRKRLLTPDQQAALLEAASTVMTVLNNRGEVLELKGRKVLVYGFDNSVYGLEQYTPPTLLCASPDLRVLLAHSPQIIEPLKRWAVNFDLLLCGHTHGGQLRLGKFTAGEARRWHVGAQRFPQLGQAAGVFFISRGLGTVKLPLRLGSPPELVLIECSSPGRHLASEAQEQPEYKIDSP